MSLLEKPVIPIVRSANSLLIAALLISLQAADAAYAPQVATVQLTDGILRISGQTFGQRPAESKVMFQPFTATKAGASAAEAGFDITGGSHDGGKRLVIDLDDGVGGGSILHQAPCLSGDIGGESFHHLGKHLPEGTTEAFASCWIKLTRTAGTPSGLIQIKGMRMSTSAPSQDAQALYYNKPKLAFSVFLSPEQKVRGNHSYWWRSDETNEHRDDRFTAPQTHWNYDDVWVSWEAYYRLNTLGQPDGALRITLGGKTAGDISDLEIKLKQQETLGYVQFSPGITNGTAGADWEFRLSRCYVATTRARVFLGDAERNQDCNGRFILPIKNWTNTEIAAEIGNRPDGYDWVYICTDQGLESEAGTALNQTR